MRRKFVITLAAIIFRYVTPTTKLFFRVSSIYSLFIVYPVINVKSAGKNKVTLFQMTPSFNSWNPRWVPSAPRSCTTANITEQKEPNITIPKIEFLFNFIHSAATILGIAHTSRLFKMTVVRPMDTTLIRTIVPMQ